MSDPSGPTVLHVSHTGEAGVGTCVGDLAADQAARGWQVAVATEPESRTARTAAAAGARVLPWSATRQPTWRVAAETRSLARIVRTVRPDVLHLHSSKAGLCGRLAVRGRIPTLFQPHCWSFEAVDGPMARLVVAWERLGARWVSAIVCVSEAERARGVAAGIRGRFRVIPNGVDTTRFAPAGEAGRRAARERLGLGTAPLVICVGRLSRQKGQDVLVDAWPSVRGRVRGAELALVGDGEELETLRQRAGGGVTLAGPRTDVPDWLAACDVVAMPSRWEGMSLGMLEAMAAGCSLVASDVPGVREAVGDAGAIVPVGDGDALAAAIVERLLDPARRAAEGEAAAARARASYDIRDTLSRTAELCLEVAAAPGG
jgi:glycosyltransferase involved in cell wall biosynthesis